MNRFTKAFYLWLHKRQVSLRPYTSFDGFHLFVEQDKVGLVISGLRLLKELYPRGYARARRFVGTIVSTWISTHYEPASEACYLNLLDCPDSVEVAASLVHEATHGYLFKVRHIPYRGALKDKIERICLSEQGRFMNLYFATGDRDSAERCRRAWKKYEEQMLASAWWRGGRLRNFLKFLRSWKASEAQEAKKST